MIQAKFIMGMPITIEIVDLAVASDFREVFQLFKQIDNRFSPYKKTSEVGKINRKEIASKDYSDDMKQVLGLAEKARKNTKGYFDVYSKGYFDPSGIVKGWAIQKATDVLLSKGFQNFFINAGGDIQTHGKKNGKKWKVGIRNPFAYEEIVKVIMLSDQAIATSGTAIRGDHIYNPHNKRQKISDIVSISVIGKKILDVDLLATAAFAMGKNGIEFISSLPDVEGYMINKNGVATYTKGLN